MRKLLDKVYFIFFSIILIIIIYLYFFNKNKYDSILNYFFHKDNTKEDIHDTIEKETDYKLFFYSYVLFYIAYFIISPFCKIRIQNIADIFYKNYKEKKLHDLFHILIPYHIYSKYIRESITILIVLIISYFIIYNPNIKFFYSLLFTYGILIILRGCIFNFTLLPKSTNECNYSTYFSSCHDLLFSGHTSKILLLLLLANYYSLIPYYILIISYILFILMIYFILSSRDHYTIDIIFGIVIALFIYIIYYKVLPYFTK